MRVLLFAALTTFAASMIPASAAPPNLPDHARTPGASDPSITEANYRTYLCRGTNSKKLHTTDEKRPNSDYTTKLKIKQLDAWGYPDKKTGHYEEDHLISLELGGADSNERNLWPEPYAGKWGAKVKDGFEGELGRRICLKATDPEHLSLRKARQIVSGDWIAAYPTYVCARSRPKLTDIMKAHCR